MKEDFHRMYRILTDETLSEIIRKNGQKDLLVNELLNEKMPDGMSFADVYDTLFLLKRQTGVRMQGITRKAPFFFYGLSARHQEMLNLIASKSSHETSLMHNMKRYLRSDSFHRVLFFDVKASFALEGLSITNERMDQLFFSSPAKHILSEQLFLNMKDMLVSIHSMIDLRFDDRFLKTIYRHLTKDLNPDAFRSHYGFRLLHPDQFVAGIKPALDKERLYHILNTECQRKDTAPIPTILILCEQLSILSPFPYFNGILVLALYVLFLFKSNFPGVAYAPIQYYQIRWKSGQLPPGAVTYSAKEIAPAFSDRCLDRSYWANQTGTSLEMMQADCSALFPNEYNISKWLLMALEITYYSLVHLENLMSQEVLIPTEYILSDASLNKRQHTTLVTATGHPEKIFTIEEHRKFFKTAYATARADLFELADKGYLVKKKEGKRFIFQLRQHELQKLIRAKGNTDI